MSNENKNVTVEHVIMVTITLVLILVPIFLSISAASNGVIWALFGEGRLFLFWGICLVLLYLYDDKISRFVSKCVDLFRSN